MDGWIKTVIYTCIDTETQTKWNETQPNDNEILIFVTTLMELEGITLIEYVRQGK